MPDYLKIKPQNLIEKEKIYDSSIINKICNDIGYSKQDIINGLKYEKKYKVLMSKQLNPKYKIKIDPKLKDIIVCYELLHDYKHRNDTSKLNDYLYTNNDNIKKKKRNKKKYINKYTNQRSTKLNDNQSELTHSFTSNKWTIGLSTNTHPKIWIQHILGILCNIYIMDDI